MIINTMRQRPLSSAKVSWRAPRQLSEFEQAKVEAKQLLKEKEEQEIVASIAKQVRDSVIRSKPQRLTLIKCR
jgi:hypothetical protein